MRTPFDRFFAFMTKPWIMITYLSIVVLSFLYLDQSISYFFYHLGLRAKLPILSWFTSLGLAPLYILGLLLGALFCRFILCNKIWEQRFWFLWSCVFIANSICLILKILFGRARPTLLFNEHLYGFYGPHTQSSFWSFPSGHTSTIISLVLGLGIVFPRYFYAFIITGITLVSLRVLLLDHYTSDVLASSYLALLEIGLFCIVLRKKTIFIKINASKF